MDSRLRVLVVVLALGIVGISCSGEDADGRSGGNAGDKNAGAAGRPARDELGHQAYQASTRLVVPAEEGAPLDRVARVAAGLSEDQLGAYIFAQNRPGEGGLVAWRDVAGEEPDGHQLAYVTEGLLASNDAGSGVDLNDFELVAQTDSGSALLVVRGDQESESFQTYDLENLDGLVAAAKEDPGLVEVADVGPGTVYRKGVLDLEREAGIDLSPKSQGKPPVEAIYDGDVEAALVPADEVLTDVLAGELRAIAVLGDERCADLPNVPTAAEAGQAVTVPVFGGIAAPADTPREVVQELGRSFSATASSPKFGRALVGTGRSPTARSPDEFSNYVEAQVR
jgi:tripartite-type tricarboxylate transporter receptor subunit TctC